MDGICILIGCGLDADSVEVEALIKTAIQERYPSHKFLGEETYAKSKERNYLIDEQPTWCIDPLDGMFHVLFLQE